MEKHNCVVRACLMALVLASPAVEAKEKEVTLKISPEMLSSLPDKSVDDLCRAATVVWATFSSSENANSLAAVCGASMDRRSAAGVRGRVAQKAQN